MKKSYMVKVTQTHNVTVLAANAVEAKKQVKGLFQDGEIAYNDAAKSIMTAELVRPMKRAANTVSGQIRTILASEGLIDLNRYWSFHNDKCKNERKLKWYYTGLMNKVTDGDVNSVKAKKVTERIKKKLDAAGIVYNKAGFRKCWSYIAFVVRVPY